MIHPSIKIHYLSGYKEPDLFEGAECDVSGDYVFIHQFTKDNRLKVKIPIHLSVINIIEYIYD